MVPVELTQVIFVTGGAGYIGSHFIEAFLQDDFFSAHQVVIIDNLSTGHREIVDVLRQLAKEKGRMEPRFEKIDLLSEVELDTVFLKYQPSAVLHFAAKISVAESMHSPELYHTNNVNGSESLLRTMKKHHCKKIVFSSTAAVYGKATGVDPLSEDTPLQPINPYGETKLKIEEALQHASSLQSGWGLNTVIFRYFNACGASRSGRLGEWHEPETHLIPLLLESVLRNEPLNVFGNDYSTRDGTCLRDYIHVEDLALAHLAGLKKLIQEKPVSNPLIYNLGSETGTSVLEVIRAAEKVTGKKVKIEVSPRRPGDAAILVASRKKAERELGWIPRHSSIEMILSTALVWHGRNHRAHRSE